MIIPDKKKAVTVILSKLHSDGSESKAEAAPEHSFGIEPEYQAMAEDLLAAIESKSVHGIASVFKALCEMIAEEDEAQDAGE